MWLYMRPFLMSVQDQDSLPLQSKPRSKSSGSEVSLWVELSGKLVQRQCSAVCWKRRKLAKALFGTMCEPSSEGGVKEWNLWMSSVRASHANLSPAQGKDLVNAIRDTFGPQFVNWCKFYVPQLCSWKTSARLPYTALLTSSAIWKSWIIAARQASSQRRRSVLPTAMWPIHGY